MPAKKQKSSNTKTELSSVRIDKWLWAARFYKTRSLANDAIKGGKILVDGEKIKPSREIKPGDHLSIRQSIFTKSIIVRQLSQRRGPASVAIGLYEETEQSIADRQRLVEIHKSQPAIRRPGLGRPTKRERRQIVSFTGKSKI